MDLMQMMTSGDREQQAVAAQLLAVLPPEYLPKRPHSARVDRDPDFREREMRQHRRERKAARRKRCQTNEKTITVKLKLKNKGEHPPAEVDPDDIMY